MKRIKDLKLKIAFTIFYIVLLVILYKLGTGCIFMRFLHIPCPGCGMTRAILSLLNLNIIDAFRYHFMFWSMPILYLYFIFDGNLFKNKKLNKTVFVLIAVGFTINWIYHIIFPI